MVLPGGVCVEVPEAPGEGGDHPTLHPALHKVSLHLRAVHHLEAAAALESAPGVVTLDQTNAPGGFQPQP